MSAAEKAMVREAARTAERHDGSTAMVRQAARAAAIIRAAEYCVAFTGAGISTSAGIGDYRGKSGKWTEEDRQKVQERLQDQDENPVTCGKRQRSVSVKEEDDTVTEVDYEDLRPTASHEALYKLHQTDLLRHVISQNCDGLHGLSGFNRRDLSELHGNIFVEQCEKCQARFERNVYVMNDDASQYYEDLKDTGHTTIKKKPFFKQCSTCSLSHRTGRKCDAKHNGKTCGGHLKDTIINFGDDLEEAIVAQAHRHAVRCDVMLCLGTTLTVTPANSLVTEGRKKAHIICNRQETDLDDMAEDNGVRVFGDCDKFILLLMKELLSATDYETWWNNRTNRLTEYDKIRTPV